MGTQQGSSTHRRDDDTTQGNDSVVRGRHKYAGRSGWYRVRSIPGWSPVNHPTIQNWHNRNRGGLRFPNYASRRGLWTGPKVDNGIKQSTGRVREGNGNLTMSHRLSIRRSQCGNDDGSLITVYRKRLASKLGGDVCTPQGVKRCFPMVPWGHEGVGPKVLSTQDQPSYRCETHTVASVSHESKLPSSCKRGNWQTSQGRVHSTS